MFNQLSILLAVTSSTAVIGLSLHRHTTAPPPTVLLSLTNIHDRRCRVHHLTTSKSSSCRLNLGPIDDLSDYGKQKAASELDTLTAKRKQIKKSKIANIKPDDDTPKPEEMTDEEIAALFAKRKKKGGDDDGGESSSAEGGGDDILLGGTTLDVDDLFARDYMPEFKIKRSGSSSRGLSAGDSGGVLDDPNEEDEETGLFVDWTEDERNIDENEFHIPNRIGFTTVDWGNEKRGFVSGKLKKNDRKSGKFNKADLRVSILVLSVVVAVYACIFMYVKCNCIYHVFLCVMRRRV